MTKSHNYSALELPGNCDRIICLYSVVGDYTECLAHQEADAVSSAVIKRKKEYSTGRWLAHHALSRLGRDTDALLSGGAREPLWPEAVTGSITHTDSRAAVAVAYTADILGIGLDMERVGAVDQKLLPKLLTDVERENLNGIDSTLIFSAKEACYKLLYPIVGEYVDFQAVEISINRADSSFDTRYIGNSPANAIVEQATGTYKRLDDHWISCAFLPGL